MLRIIYPLPPIPAKMLGVPFGVDS